MPMIRECIVTTLNDRGIVHIAPLGLIVEEGGFIIAPVRPSTTLDNLRINPYAVANFTDDPRPATPVGMACGPGLSRASRSRNGPAGRGSARV